LQSQSSREQTDPWAACDPPRAKHEAGSAESLGGRHGSSDGQRGDRAESGCQWVELVRPGRDIGVRRAVTVTAGPRTPGSPRERRHPARTGQLATDSDRAEREPRGARGATDVTIEGSAQHYVYAFPTVPFSIVRKPPGGIASARGSRTAVLDGYWGRVQGRAGRLGDRRRHDRAALRLRETGGFDRKQGCMPRTLDIGGDGRGGRPTPLLARGASAPRGVSASTDAAFGDEEDRAWIEASYACNRPAPRNSAASCRRADRSRDRSSVGET